MTPLEQDFIIYYFAGMAVTIIAGILLLKLKLLENWIKP